MTPGVDEYVKTRIPPQYQDIAEAIRDLVRTCAPNAKEDIAYDMPVWKINRIFAYITSNKQGITFSFTRGIRFKDNYGLLKGVGKSARHVKLKDVQAVRANEAALRDYIQQALALDANESLPVSE